MAKVLRIINRLNLGGPSYNVAYLSKYLSDKYETKVLSGYKDESEASSDFILENLGIEAEYIPGMERAINPRNDYKAYRHIYKIIKEYKPDVVHTHASKSGFLGRLAAANLKVPVIVHTFHGHVFHSYFGKLKTRMFIELERYLARRSTKLIAISPAQRLELVESFSIAKKEKFEIVRLGFDLQRFQEDMVEKRSSFRNEFSILDDEIAIGIIGRLVPIKNHTFFLNVINRVRNSTDKKIRVFIVGDGESRADIEAQASQLNLDFSTEKDHKHRKILCFTSWRKDIDRINAGMDIIALTSLNEGTPVSVIEALASTNPVISTKVGGVEDIVQENESGLLYDLDDESGFADGLLTLISDSDMRKKMGEIGKQFVLEQYHYLRLAREVEQLYDKLLQKTDRDS